MNDTSKIIQALCYIANSQPNATVDTMKAYKLLWLADRLHLRNYSRTISGDEYWALPLGPVPTNAKNLVDGKATSLKNPDGKFDEYIEVLPNHKIRARKGADVDEFSESDIELFDKVLAKFGNASAIELSNFSHQFPEWKQYEHLLKDSSKKNGYHIDKDLFFVNMDEPSGLYLDDPEKLEFTKEMFHLYQER